MGREIRKVIPNWKHPIRSNGSYQPLYDESYIESINEWIKDHLLWEKGEHPDQKDVDCKRYEHFAEWGGNPTDIEYFRPNWKEDEMTWIQVYETVSEGTPVTPPFQTKDELINYLIENGDFLDQRRRKEGVSLVSCDPWTKEQAESFIHRKWAPSGILLDGKYMSGVEGLTEI